MDWEKYSAIATVVGFPILVISVLIQILDRFERRNMKEISDTSISQSPFRKKTDQFLGWKWWKALSIALFFTWITSLFFWSINSNVKMKKSEAIAIQYSNEVSTLQSEMFQDLPPTNLIVGKTFRNEIVSLDGNSYRDCKFFYVTFKYEGKRPISMKNNEIYPPVSFETSPDITMFEVFLDSCGVINTNKMDTSEFRKYE